MSAFKGSNAFDDDVTAWKIFPLTDSCISVGPVVMMNYIRRILLVMPCFLEKLKKNVLISLYYSMVSIWFYENKF